MTKTCRFLETEKIIQRLSLVGSMLFALLLLLSCTNPVTFETVENEKSLLWEVTGNDLKKPSYILGTMHLMCAEDAHLSDNVKYLIKHVDTIYLEVDLDNASELLSGILDLRTQRGSTLSDVLTIDDYNKVKSFFETHQPAVPFSLLEKQPPLMLSSSIYEVLMTCKKKNGIELKIVDEAFLNKKETRGLETIAYQASLFDSIPYEQQAKDLVNAIDSLPKHKVMMEEMVRLYKEQDIERLYTMSENEDSGVSNCLELLLHKRNRNWVEKFPSITRDVSILIAVGAGHLGGSKGVLQLLKDKGYTVRAVYNK